MTKTARSFTDADGRKWKVRIGYKSIKVIRDSELDIDLATLLADEMAGLTRLLTDPILFIDVMWLLCEGEYDITDEAFGEAMRGDGLQNAQEAFMGALSDFYPSQQGKMLQILMAKTKEMQVVAMDKLQGCSIQKLISGDGELNLEQLLASEPTSSDSRSENSNGHHSPSSGRTGTDRVKSVQSSRK